MKNVIAEADIPEDHPGHRVFLVQHEHGGIPYDPVAALTYEEASELFEETVTKLGFPRAAGQSNDDYFAEYWDAIRNEIDPDVFKTPRFQDYDWEDDTVRTFSVVLPDVRLRHQMLLAEVPKMLPATPMQALREARQAMRLFWIRGGGLDLEELFLVRSLDLGSRHPDPRARTWQVSPAAWEGSWRFPGLSGL